MEKVRRHNIFYEEGLCYHGNRKMMQWLEKNVEKKKVFLHGR